ncbi:MAG: D-alanyl-D-alanine carboxypeptidase [Alphaproteobacteria bacterium]|nr:D-alanyl-D-alanine carboxypeptidase [Alphaproteobacteria bacterium]
MSKTVKKTRYCNKLLVHWRKHTGRILLYLIVACITLAPVKTQAKNIDLNVYKEKYAAFVVDTGTGRVLYHKNENKILHPASLTKLMTLLMVFDALDNGRLKLYSRVYISRHAADMSPSKLGLPVGSTIKVEDAILSLVTKSANDVAAAIAEKLGGTEKEFAYKMNRKARSLGMKQTHFRNASGLHDPKQVSTARDMALLARILITDYEKYYHYFSTKSFTYEGKTYRNHNKLMQSYKGMDGMKTGYIRPSGFNLIASVTRGDHRLIGVIFGGRNGKLRNAQMKKLLDNAFTKVEGIYILANEVPIPKKKPITSIAYTHNNDKSDDNILSVASTPNTIQQEKFSRWDMLYSSQEDSMFNRMIGEGDYDITVRNRIETGLIAISAQLNNISKDKSKKQTQTETSDIIVASIHDIEPSATPLYHEISQNLNNNWSIQIGAFTTKDRAENALTETLNMLPMSLNSAKTRIAPIKTAQGWIYRGRFDGYSKNDAKDACAALPDCIVLAPLNN